jgi:hypothetical protein
MVLGNLHTSPMRSLPQRKEAAEAALGLMWPFESLCWVCLTCSRSPYPYLGRDDLKFFVDLFSDTAERFTASTDLLFFWYVVDHLHPEKISRKGFAAPLDTGMSPNRNPFLFLLHLFLGGDRFRLVEQPQLFAVLFGKPFSTAAKQTTSHQLQFFKVLQSLVLLLDAFVVFLLQAFLHPTELLFMIRRHLADHLLQLLNAVG